MNETDGSGRAAGILRHLLLVYCLAPTAACAVFLSYAVRARFVLGRWPVMYNPDPKNLGLPVHHGIAGVALVAGSLSVVLFPFIAVASNWAAARDRRLGLGLFAGGWILFLLVAYRFAGWYLD